MAPRHIGEASLDVLLDTLPEDVRRLKEDVESLMHKNIAKIQLEFHARKEALFADWKETEGEDATEEQKDYFGKMYAERIAELNAVQRTFIAAERMRNNSRLLALVEYGAEKAPCEQEAGNQAA